MPQSRNTKSTTGKKNGKASAKRQGGSKRQTAPKTRRPSEPVLADSAKNDILGVVLAVLAIAMLLALVAPTSAALTHAVERGLTLCFGVGAVLCPIGLFLWSLTFFMDDDETPIRPRVAVGLLMIVLSILSLISMMIPGADEAPLLAVMAEEVEFAGGYVGGGIAWVLLTLVGRYVGVALLIGVIVAGVIVCGFSVSGFIATTRERAQELRERRQAAREERALMREQEELERLEREEEERSLPEGGESGGEDGTSADDGPRASYIGSRKTTVLDRARKGILSRGDAPAPEAAEDETRPAEAKTERLGREPKEAPKTVRIPQSDAAIPAFLKNPKAPHSKSRDDSADATDAADSAPAKTSAGPAGKRGQAPKAPRRQDPPKSVHRPGDDSDDYELPPLSMLSSNPNSAGSADSEAELQETMRDLQDTLHEFGLKSRVVDSVPGPLVTTFRVEMGEGERVSKIRNLEDDIALTLAAEKVRIFAPIPGTSYVGIEIPNKTRQNVHLGDVLPYAKGSPLEVAIGRDASGRPVVADLAKMPHMLVAGTTGSGKSVLINSMIMSLLMRTTPKQVRMIMVDPKRVEFTSYNGLPHLYVPVVTEPRQAASALQWAVSEMERRLKVFAKAGARNLLVYNKMCTSGKLSEMDNPPEPMPYLVVIIDELSDLMMVAGKDVEASIVRIAQLARAAGIHLIIATQRPSANVVTGLIKSNIDTRAALKVSSGIDSRVILDETGAERLLGNGDMLFKNRGLTAQRVLGCYTSDNEINEVVEFIRAQGEPDYHEEILSAVVPGQPSSSGSDLDEEDDPLLWEAAQIVVESQLGSTSGLQRRLKVGYARAGRIMDMLEQKGVVGPPDGSKPREVLLDEDGLEDLRTQIAKYEGV